MLPDLHSLALFMAATLLLNVTPGPDMMFIAARSAARWLTPAPLPPRMRP